jgi:hypothetical protein
MTVSSRATLLRGLPALAVPEQSTAGPPVWHADVLRYPADTFEANPGAPPCMGPVTQALAYGDDCYLKRWPSQPSTSSATSLLPSGLQLQLHKWCVYGLDGAAIARELGHCHP